MELSLAQVLQATGAQLFDAFPEARARGWSIDSRTVSPGDLFFAIKGERFDGHAYTDAAVAKGAVAAVVSEAAGSVPRLLVADTLVALQRLAQWARVYWGGPVVAVTGSAGKTSTKDIIAELLSTRFRVAKTSGNLNNHIGLPLTLLRIPADAQVAVIEMGMNHAGEIRQLSVIAEPQYGVVTNVGFAHVEYFSSIEGVAAAKRELIEALPSTGIAILNADDERVLKFRESHAGAAITYGFSPKADLRAADVKIGPDGAAFTVDGVRFNSGLTGRHGVSNTLAGLAVSTLFGSALQDLVDAVARLAPGKMRGERTNWNGVTVLNDSYNSNPEAARNMLDVLAAEPANRKIAVLGAMLELGSMSEQLHRELGNYSVQCGVDLVVGVSGAARFVLEGARDAGLPADAALFFDDPETAGAFLREFVRAGDAVLFKGSRGTHVERALAGMEA